MKGYSLLVSYLNEKSDEKEFVKIIDRRIKKLLARLEIIDGEITSLGTEKLNKKRSQRLYFTSLGQIAAYKVVIKSLDY